MKNIAYSQKISDTVELSVDKEKNVMWLTLGSATELHYSYETICNFYDAIVPLNSIVKRENLTHVIIVSKNKQVWNMGGDLQLFVNSIKKKDFTLLKDYAYKCVEGIYNINTGFGNNAVVISALQGNAFGGGFECALACDYIFAEEHVLFSFPEALFGSFPGMGAYSFLTRKLGYPKALELIYSKKKWSAGDMKDLGLINDTYRTGTVLENIIAKFDRGELIPPTPFSKICNTVPSKELKDIVDLWLQDVAKLSEREVWIMEKILDVQKKKTTILNS